jgi:hypothetical protein
MWRTLAPSDLDPVVIIIKTTEIIVATRHW